MPSLKLENVSVIYPMRRVSRGRQHELNSKREDGVGSKIVIDGPPGILALESINLDLKSGDRIAIVGRNGSGKSTLLSVMAGIFPPSNGVVSCKGQISSMFNVGIGMKTEATGIDNIVLGGLIRGLSRSQAEAKIDEIAEFSGLGDYLLLPVRTYSRGMAMRLGFSIATAFNPEILLLDEWIGAGDKAFREKAQERMRSLVDGAGIVALASHRIPLLKNVCNCFLWLESGQVVGYSKDPKLLDEFQAQARADNAPISTPASSLNKSSQATSISE